MPELSNAAYAARLLIVGNSGSGKSTLAGRIAAHTGHRVVPLDDIYWSDQRLLKKRSQADAQDLARLMGAQDHWIVEGVFGWLHDLLAPRATGLIWLDLPWAACEHNLRTRGPQRQTDAEFEDLLVWAGGYWERRSSSSHYAHATIYENFAGEKTVLRSRDEADACLAGLPAGNRAR